MKNQPLNRLAFLRGSAGACLALPMLELYSDPTRVPKRIFAKSTFYSFVPDYFFPREEGRNYQMPETLATMTKYSSKMTLFSGLDHNMSGGHEATKYFLSGIKTNESKGYAEGNISIDQKAAQYVGSQTRFPSLVLGTDGPGTDSISWTNTSSQIHPIKDLDTLMSLLFHNPTKKKVHETEIEYKERHSILDLVRDQAKKFEANLGQVDRDKLDQYFTSVRELEQKMTQSKARLYRDKPSTNYKLPNNSYGMTLKDQLPLFYDLILLAFQTDSTRVITLNHHGLGRESGGLSGVKHDYHALSHHGKVIESIRELLIIEKFFISEFSRFVEKLEAIQEPNGKSMLDNTMAMVGSGMGNANSHSNKDLPILLAGGGFRHGEHKHYEKVNRRSTPLCNLFLTMLQNFGLEIDQFNNSTGTLKGIEVA